MQLVFSGHLFDEHCLICHCVSPVLLSPSEKGAAIVVSNETYAYRTTDSRVTGHISINTYQMVTNLFSSSWFSEQLDIILLAHTLGTCDFFLSRVLPYTAFLFFDDSPTLEPETLERKR